MANIKIFNSEKEVKEKGLEGKFVSRKRFATELGNPLIWISYAIHGEFKPIQRLKKDAKNSAKNLNADYGVIADEFETYANKYYDKILAIEVNFYKKGK